MKKHTIMDRIIYKFREFIGYRMVIYLPITEEDKQAKQILENFQNIFPMWPLTVVYNSESLRIQYP